MGIQLNVVFDKYDIESQENLRQDLDIEIQHFRDAPVQLDFPNLGALHAELGKRQQNLDMYESIQLPNGQRFIDVEKDQLNTIIDESLLELRKLRQPFGHNPLGAQQDIGIVSPHEIQTNISTEHLPDEVRTSIANHDDITTSLGPMFERAKTGNFTDLSINSVPSFGYHNVSSGNGDKAQIDFATASDPNSSIAKTDAEVIDNLELAAGISTDGALTITKPKKVDALKVNLT